MPGWWERCSESTTRTVSLWQACGSWTKFPLLLPDCLFQAGTRTCGHFGGLLVREDRAFVRGLAKNGRHSCLFFSWKGLTTRDHIPPQICLLSKTQMLFRRVIFSWSAVMGIATLTAVMLAPIFAARKLFANNFSCFALLQLGM